MIKQSAKRHKEGMNGTYHKNDNYMPGPTIHDM